MHVATSTFVHVGKVTLVVARSCASTVAYVVERRAERAAGLVASARKYGGLRREATPPGGPAYIERGWLYCRVTVPWSWFTHYGAKRPRPPVRGGTAACRVTSPGRIKPYRALHASFFLLDMKYSSLMSFSLGSKAVACGPGRAGAWRGGAQRLSQTQTRDGRPPHSPHARATPRTGTADPLPDETRRGAAECAEMCESPKAASEFQGPGPGPDPHAE